MEKKLAHQLRDVTEATARLYGNDLQIAERLLSHLLTFETQQSGFGLTATQDAYFNEVRKTSCLVCMQKTDRRSNIRTLLSTTKEFIYGKMNYPLTNWSECEKERRYVVKLISMEMTLNKL